MRPRRRTGVFSTLWGMFKSPFCWHLIGNRLHHHVYCYRHRVCTQCGHRHVGYKEPEYVPHIEVNGKLRPRGY